MIAPAATAAINSRRRSPTASSKSRLVDCLNKKPAHSRMAVMVNPPNI